MRNAINIIFALTFVAILGFAPSAFAQDKITVEVRAISATQGAGGYDTKLNDIQRKLKKAFGSKFSHFTEIKTESLVFMGKIKKTTSLPNGNELTLGYLGKNGEFIKLQLGIAGKMNSTLRVKRGKTFFQAGLRYGKGILILAITVK